MKQGIASTYIENTKKEYNYGIFEVDEGSMDRILEYIEPDYIVITNFFRDQLDRYGEIENTITEVYNAIKNVDTTLILNCDDPFVAYFKDLGKKNIFYSVNKSYLSTSDPVLSEIRNCKVCGSKLVYNYYNYSHLGDYFCESCDFKRPLPDYYLDNLCLDDNKQRFNIVSEDDMYCDVFFPYEGLFNLYNCCAAFSVCSEVGLSGDLIVDKIMSFSFSLGRLEELYYKDRVIKIVLIKNPIGASEVMKLVSYDSRIKSLVFVLNDNPADGRDISWIWDVSYVRDIFNVKNIYCSGRRADDLALRINYLVEDRELIIDHSIESCVEHAVEDDVEIVYILPTYSAIYYVQSLVYDLVGKK